ncbi:MAG TPA: hypothetical protein VKB92_13340 [Myxococcales bacterium]|nr:hypothetical protein [Myxococcales bacterium]
MTAVQAAETAIKRAEVAVRPLLLTDANAAAMLGRSKAWIRRLRGEDQRRLRNGQPIKGPRWSVIERSVFYKLSDLEDWVARRATPLGTIPFTGNHPSRRRTERERAAAGRTP